MKAAPLTRALRNRVNETLIHSGQHYDPELADLFFDELDIPAPDHALEVGPGTPNAQIAHMISRLDPLLEQIAPDMVLVYGDTTTTLAGSLAAAKRGIPIGHIEAGLRSFVRSMPEEQNRVVTDHLSTLLFVPTDVAVQNLRREGIESGVHVVGDVMFDAARLFAPIARTRTGPAEFGVTAGEYALITVHRAAATDTRQALLQLLDVMATIQEPAIFPVHPRTRSRLQDEGLWDQLTALPNIRCCPPIGYLDFTALLTQARIAITDSGGVQKEAFFHGIPCITLRDETEWIEIADGGFSVLTGLDPVRVAAALARDDWPTDRPDFYGDGHAADLIADTVYEWIQEHTSA